MTYSSYSRAFFVIFSIFFFCLKAHATDGYPSRGIKILVPLSAGSAADAYARLIGNHLQTILQQPVVIENRTGAGGTIGATAVARSAPDGYTLLISSNTTQAAAPALRKALPYDPAKDFTPIARLGDVPSVIVANLDFQPRTLKELIEFAKANPGKVSYATVNSTGVIVGSALSRLANIELVHVPYNTTAQAMADVLGGRVTLLMTSMVDAWPQIQAKSVRPIAVPSRDRYRRLPDTPSVSEAGFPTLDMMAWLGLFGPAGMPESIVQRLDQSVQQILAKPEVQERVSEIGLEVVLMSRTDFEQFTKSEIEKWTQAVRNAGIEPQ